MQRGKKGRRRRKKKHRDGVKPGLIHKT